MTARLRLDLIVRRYPVPAKITTSTIKVEGGFGSITSGYTPQPDVDRWTWRLWAGSRIVSTSGSQLYSRRIDCARGAEVGAGLVGVEPERDRETLALRYCGQGKWTTAEVRIIDERGGAS